MAPNEHGPRPSLAARAGRVVRLTTGVSEEKADEALERAGGNIRSALRR